MDNSLTSQTHYWLLKSEPDVWSWQDQLRSSTAVWDGVRNYQACNNLKAMTIGDQAFFYHSVKERQIVGIVEIVKAAYIDPKDPLHRFVNVDVKALMALPNPISLETIKNDPHLNHLALVRQSRLSVMPIDEASWHIICGLGGVQL